MNEGRTKREWRTEFLRRRAETDPNVIRAILSNAKAWIPAQHSVCVHGYLAKRDTHEIETRDLLAFLVSSGMDVVVPRILDMVTGTMELVSWHPGMPHHLNRFGIEEPVGGTVVSRKDVDLWIVPSLGVDKAGNRLGYGAGFYDRMLKDTAGVKAGLLPESCVVDALPVEPYDVPLDVVITQNGVFNSYL